MCQPPAMPNSAFGLIAPDDVGPLHLETAGHHHSRHRHVSARTYGTGVDEAAASGLKFNREDIPALVKCSGRRQQRNLNGARVHLRNYLACRRFVRAAGFPLAPATKRSLWQPQ